MEKAKHFDTGKIGVDQIPPEMLLELGRIYSYGEKKYGRDNWKGGMDWSQVYGSAMRHILSFWDGQDLDLCDDSNDCAGEGAEYCPKHSRLPHLAHAIWNITTLMYYQNHSVGTDNRDNVSIPEEPEYDQALIDAELLRLLGQSNNSKSNYDESSRIF